MGSEDEKGCHERRNSHLRCEYGGDLARGRQWGVGRTRVAGRAGSQRGYMRIMRHTQTRIMQYHTSTLMLRQDPSRHRRRRRAMVRSQPRLDDREISTHLVRGGSSLGAARTFSGSSAELLLE